MLATLPPIRTTFAFAIALNWLLLIPQIAQSYNKPQDPPPAESNPDQEQKDKAETADPDSNPADSGQQDKNDAGQEKTGKSDEAGQADLDKAFELKIAVTSTRDLDRVADLCELAIEKGLDAESEAQAKELWASVLYDNARQLDLRIAPDGTLSTRWRWLRSQAISRLQKAIELSPGKIDALILLAKLHTLDGGDREAAIKAIEKAIAQVTDDSAKLSEALYIRARLAEDDTAKIADLTQAIKIDPKNFEALMQRAMYFLNENKTPEAMSDFKSLLKIEAENVSRHRLIAEELLRRELTDEVIEILDLAIEAEPENEVLLVLRAQSLFANDDANRALTDLNKALEIKPLDTNALNLRARVYITQKEFDKALDDANELIQQLPDSEIGLALRSLIYRSQMKLDKAIADVEAMLEKNENNLDFQYDLAILLNANEEPTRALPYFDTILSALAASPDTEQLQTDILRSRGDAWLSLGKHEKAIDDYEHALDLIETADSTAEDSEDKERDAEVKSGILNNLAWVLATSKIDDLRDGKRALKLATQASELTEYKAAFILSTLASGYAETGDFENARKWAAKAVELAESDEQRVGLQEELDSYKKDEPWREMENVEEKKKKQQDEPPDGEKKTNSDQDSEDKSEDIR